MNRKLRFAAIGLDHRHIYHLVAENIAAGAECVGYCPRSSDPNVLDGFRARFPQSRPAARERLLDDPSIDFVVCAAIPVDRPAIALAAMRAGKDVMVDKPGAVTEEQVVDLERVARETGRIFSICFSERFVVRACEAASRLAAEGAIGRVVHTTGLGPHRLNRPIRPEWFFRPETFGGILTDIASHQIDQFLHFTGNANAEIAASSVANHALPDVPAFEDFGEIMLRADNASGYIRVDWHTPDGLPTWGDGRLFLLGTEGTMELRKYVDVDGRPGADHLFLVDRKGARHVDCSAEPLTYFARFQDDVRDRTAGAMPDGHALAVTRLAIAAQSSARRLGSKP
jgi:predicted dehydrogenase